MADPEAGSSAMSWAWNPHRAPLGLGNYDVNALMYALQQKGYDMQWADKRKPLDKTSLDFDALEGVLCNVVMDTFFRSLWGQRRWMILQSVEPSESATRAQSVAATAAKRSNCPRLKGRARGNPGQHDDLHPGASRTSRSDSRAVTRVRDPGLLEGDVRSAPRRDGLQRQVSSALPWPSSFDVQPRDTRFRFWRHWHSALHPLLQSRSAAASWHMGILSTLCVVVKYW